MRFLSRILFGWQEKWNQFVCFLAGHEWDYYVDETVSYTGYLEHCRRCGIIIQIPQ